MNDHPAASLRDFYPHLTDEELKEAEENLQRYLELVWRIYERRQVSPDAHPQAVL